MKRRWPMLGDKIEAPGVETLVAAFDFVQTEAPYFFAVTDSAASELRVEWRDGVWALPNTAVAAPRVIARASAPVDFPRAPRVKLPAPAPASKEAPFDPKLSPEIMALHERLDAARVAYDDARKGHRADRVLETLEAYCTLIEEADRLDPLFYLGRVKPMAPLQRGEVFIYRRVVEEPVLPEEEAA